MLRRLRGAPALARGRDFLPRLVRALFVLLAATLVLGRFPLPGGDSFGFNSLARNMVVAALLAHLLGARELRLSTSPLGNALLLYLAAAALSVALSRGAAGDLRTFADATGTFFIARAFAAEPHGERRLILWLGAIALGIVARELLANPDLIVPHESGRFVLITDHANTLGYAFAVLPPLFLGAAAAGQGLVAGLSAAGSAFGALISFSRAAWVCVALAALAIANAPRLRPDAGGRRVSRLAATLLAAGAVAAAIVIISSGRSEADSQRLRIMNASLTLFREHWLFGIGFGSKNLEQLFRARYIELFGTGLFLFHSHNFYVDALVGGGVVGGAAAAFLIARLLGVARRALRARSRRLRRVDRDVPADRPGRHALLS